MPPGLTSFVHAEYVIGSVPDVPPAEPQPVVDQSEIDRLVEGLRPAGFRNGSPMQQQQQSQPPAKLAWQTLPSDDPRVFGGYDRYKGPRPGHKHKSGDRGELPWVVPHDNHWERRREYAAEAGRRERDNKWNQQRYHPYRHDNTLTIIGSASYSESVRGFQ